MTKPSLAAPAGLDPAGQPSVTDERGRRLQMLPAIAAAELETKPVSWLWPERIPLGLLTYLVGDPGLGKSLLSLLLVAKLSQGELATGEANSLLLSAEDAREHVVLPRLQAAGADLARVFFPPLGEDEFEQPISLPDDLDRLRDLIFEVEAKLVVIDPFVAHLPERVNSWQDQSVRTALAPLHRLAGETEAALLLIGHLNKADGSNPLRRIGGSIGIGAAARSILLLGRDPDDPDGEVGSRRVLAHVKSNVGPLSPSVCFGLEAVPLPDNPGVESVCLVEGGLSRVTGSQLLAEQGQQQPQLKLELAISFLENELAAGPRLAAEVQAKAKEQGISRTTLERAKYTLRVDSEKAGLTNGWVWRLPDPNESESEAD